MRTTVTRAGMWAALCGALALGGPGFIPSALAQDAAERPLQARVAEAIEKGAVTPSSR